MIQITVTEKTVFVARINRAGPRKAVASVPPPARRPEGNRRATTDAFDQVVVALGRGGSAGGVSLAEHVRLARPAIPSNHGADRIPGGVAERLPVSGGGSPWPLLPGRSRLAMEER